MTSHVDRADLRRGLPLALIGLHIALFALALSVRPDGWGADAARFDEIASSHLVPYREQQVEYMPLELGFVEAAARDGLASTEARLATVTLVSDMAIAAALFYGWGRRPCLWYLAVSVALLPFLFFRFDLVSVAVATWGIALIVRQKERAGGSLLALGLMVKVWPIALLAVIWNRPRALRWWSFSTLIALSAWILVSGLSAPFQVATFRSATGWEAGSAVGISVLIATGAALRDESGAARVGTSTRWEEAALALALFVILIVIGRKYHQAGGADLGGAALASVAAVLILAPVFSPQYAAWLLPWTAIAACSTKLHDRKVAWLSCGVIVLTGVHALSMAISTVSRVLFLSLIPIRDFLCLAIVILWLAADHRDLEQKGVRRSPTSISQR